MCRLPLDEKKQMIVGKYNETKMSIDKKEATEQMREPDQERQIERGWRSAHQWRMFVNAKAMFKFIACVFGLMTQTTDVYLPK